MNKQDIEGHGPPEPGAGSPAPAGEPAALSLEQQLAREREARMLMRDRLRHTEALAAESQALRSQMMQELERVKADRDRLKAEAATAAPVSPDIDLDPAAAAAPADGFRAPTPRFSAPGPVEPTLAPPRAPQAGAAARPSAGDRPLQPPARSPRGPWRALAMLGGLAVVVAGLAWLTGTLPGGFELASNAAPGSALDAGGARSAPGAVGVERSGSAAIAAAPTPAPASAPPLPGNAVALPPVSPEAQVAANPTAAGTGPGLAAPASAGLSSTTAPNAANGTPVAPAALPSAMPGALATAAAAPGTSSGLPDRLRKALDAEGIAAAVDVDAATGHVVVADPQADRAQRDRTEMLIRAVYAGASLPEPQIEHRWVSPRRGERAPGGEAQASTPAPVVVGAAGASPAAADAARHPEATGALVGNGGAAGAERRRKSPEAAPPVTVADAEELRPVLPAGRVTASCMESLAGRSGSRRANLTACMKRSCCSSAANLNSDECRAYQKTYTYTCGPG